MRIEIHRADSWHRRLAGVWTPIDTGGTPVPQRDPLYPWRTWRLGVLGILGAILWPAAALRYDYPPLKTTAKP